MAHLEQLDALYGPMPGRAAKPVVLVVKTMGRSTSRNSRAALTVCAHWLTVEWVAEIYP